MNIIKKIREILSNENLDLADKIIEIESTLPKEKVKEYRDIFGQKCEIKREGNAVIFDGGAGFEYTDNPRLENQDDLYYTGCGCTWDTDLDGARYWKRYNPSVMRGDRYGHLSYGDIVNEKARMKKLIKECLSEMD
tara:strand:- start:56 stop:463 length:408 start_codon:yes stop_codon:yes gene_type:complete